MKLFSFSTSQQQTLPDCLLRSDDLGYREMLKVTSLGLTFSHVRYVFSPEELIIRDHCQFINKNDRRGYSRFFLLESADGRKGYLIEEETEFSDGRVVEFLRDVPTKVNTTKGSGKSWFRTMMDGFYQE